MRKRRVKDTLKAGKKKCLGLRRKFQKAFIKSKMMTRMMADVDAELIASLTS